jgi:hypothetical protein
MLGAGSLVGFFTVAWPTAEFAGMNIEGAVKLGYRKELAAIEDPDATPRRVRPPRRRGLRNRQGGQFKRRRRHRRRHRPRGHPLLDRHGSAQPAARRATSPQEARLHRHLVRKGGEHVERPDHRAQPDGADVRRGRTRRRPHPPGGGHRHPVIVNYNPYHKDGRGGRLAVESVHRHLAERGYACLTLDFRGLGNSAGRNPEPFAPQEARDGYDAVEWIAAQPWCDGNVGMWGVSYPGITSLSTAALRPPHLKAIVPIHATSDLYRGVVGLGGCASRLLDARRLGPAHDRLQPQPALAAGPGRPLGANLGRASGWATTPGSPPSPTIRASTTTGSPASPASPTSPAPTFLICGWRDLYADDTPRDFNGISAPRKLLMGPWKHEFPDTAGEAPAAGLWDMQRWFDRFLKGERNGIDAEPPVSIHVQGQPPRLARRNPIARRPASHRAASSSAPTAASIPHPAEAATAITAYDPDRRHAVPRLGPLDHLARPDPAARPERR